jgi:hypothetical protein
MSELTDKLQAAGEKHKGTDLGALLQWAALHIQSQDEALAETREELQQEEAERIKLETALHAAKSKAQEVLDGLQAAWCPPVKLARDFAPHINLMGGQGDPDYLTKSGMSIRHTDLREQKPRKKKS